MTGRKRPRERLDALLLEEGLAADLREATGLIMAGKVLVDDVVCSKPGTAVPRSSEVRVRGRRLQYASRGGFKLAAALDAFDCSVGGRVVLDAGASTGGFTDCLIQRGAKRVYAVDVGFGQLRGRLAADDRVVNMERTNISDVKRADLDPPITLAVADLSNLSLRKAIPTIASLFHGDVEIVALVKPLFEGVDRMNMEDPEALGQALETMLTDLEGAGFGWKDVAASPVRGGRSSVEFLVMVTRGVSTGRARIVDAVTRIPPPGTIY